MEADVLSRKAVSFYVAFDLHVITGMKGLHTSYNACQKSWYTNGSFQGQIQPFPLPPLKNVGLLQNDVGV